ncbi:helix-turn-helix transcriptional regulator [Desertimonas flava]|uniref:helix-turn-helix transcriptional regulator n=1 Tax=Desertimonas flava TaxID=2064846 RepID=UPI0023F01955|nr:WYL domain-containing protein [Desertimonas flava]
MAQRIDRVERLTNLLALLLETPRPLSLVEIAAELEGQYTSTGNALRAAFERDKAALRDIGVPIESEHRDDGSFGTYVYWIDRARYELADLDLEPDETRGLQMAFAAVRSTSGSAMTAGEEALWKLGGGDAFESAALVTASVPELPALPVLRDAAARRAVVQFGYHGRRREVDPYGLLLRNGFWYVLGRDHGHDEQRTYRVDRIEGDATIVGDGGAFERPAGFDPRDAFPADAKRFGVGATGDETAAAPTTASVRISADRAVLVERQLGSDRVTRRYKRGDIVVDVPCANLDAFGSWVLGLTDHAEVLSPPAARAAVVDRLRAIAATPPRTRRKAAR